MKPIQNLIDIIEEHFEVNPYYEDNILCGYELNTYTDQGVNEILFLDFREDDLNPNDPIHFKNVFGSYIASIDLDERIEMNRQNEQYKNEFTLRQSLEDFDSWYLTLRSIDLKMNEPTYYITQETKNKHEELRQLLQEFDCEDCIIDRICKLFNYPDTNGLLNNQ